MRIVEKLRDVLSVQTQSSRWMDLGKLTAQGMLDGLTKGEDATMPLKEMPKVGDKVRYIGTDYNFVTTGNIYEIVDIDEDSDAVIRYDDGRAGYIYEFEFKDYELVEPTPDTASLIANLALRVGELEKDARHLRLQNAQQAHEINELYRADAERGVLR